MSMSPGSSGTPREKSPSTIVTRSSRSARSPSSPIRPRSTSNAGLRNRYSTRVAGRGPGLRTDQQDDPPVGHVAEQPLEDHLSQEAGDAGQQDRLAREAIDDRGSRDVVGVLYHAADYATIYQLVDKPRSSAVKAVPAAVDATSNPSGGPVSLRSKILAVMAVPVIVLGIATGALLRARQQTTEALDAERNAVAVRDTLDQILVDLTDAETGSRGYILTGRSVVPRALHAGSRGAPRRHPDADGSDRQRPRRGGRDRGSSGCSANQRLSLLQTIQLLAPVTGLTNHSQLVSEMSRGKVVMDQIRSSRGQRGVGGGGALGAAAARPRCVASGSRSWSASSGCRWACWRR